MTNNDVIPSRPIETVHYVIFCLPVWSVRQTILQLSITQFRPDALSKFSRYLSNSSIMLSADDAADDVIEIVYVCSLFNPYCIN